MAAKTRAIRVIQTAGVFGQAGKQFYRLPIVSAGVKKERLESQQALLEVARGDRELPAEERLRNIVVCWVIRDRHLGTRQYQCGSQAMPRQEQSWARLLAR